MYAIRLPVNDYAVAYVGVSKNPCKRFSDHRRNKEHSEIGRAICACGPENVIFVVIESGDREAIYEREAELINSLNTRWPNGYNVAIGGHGGRDPLPTTRAKMSAAQLGKIVRESTRDKMAAAKIGRPSGFGGHHQRGGSIRKMLFTRLRRA